MKSNKFWFGALAALLLLSAVAMLLQHRKTAQLALVYLDGVLIETIDLLRVSEPYSFTVSSGDGFNEITVEHGCIYVSDSNCPGRQCVRPGGAVNGAVPIVCLPHRLVIRFETASLPEIDAIVG